MGLKIRLRQQGRRNKVMYRLVLADHHSPRDGKYLEMLGWYNPHNKEDNFKLNAERIFYWISQGAEVSEKAFSLVKQGAPGVYEEFRLRQLAKKTAKCQKKRLYRQRLSEKKQSAVK